MALTKIINDESKSFRPVLTDKLVLDAVPTEGSFNGVTSDGVAKAIAEGGGGGGDIFVAEGGETSYQDIADAFAAGKTVFVHRAADDRQIPLASIDNNYAHFVYSDIVNADEKTIAVYDYTVDTGDHWSGGFVKNLPNFYPSDVGKVLQIVKPGTVTYPEWVTPSGSNYSAGAGIAIKNDKINVRVDVDNIQIKSDTVVSTDNDYTYDYRNIDLWSMTSSTKCDWAFGSDSTAFEITATAAQAGRQIRAALYDGNGVRISVSSHYFTSWGSMPKTLVEGTNSFNGGWQWTSIVRPSGATFGTEFPLPEDRSYEEVATIALVAYDSANSQVVGDPLPFTHNSDIQFKMETDANSRLSVKNPLPDSSGASQGDVLSIGLNGPEWGAAPSGGGDVYWAEYQVTTFNDVWQAASNGKIVYCATTGHKPSQSPSDIYVFQLVSIDSNPGGIAVFAMTKLSYGAAEISTFTLDQNDTWSSDYKTGMFMPDYNPDYDEGKVLKIVSGTATWVTP